MVTKKINHKNLFSEDEKNRIVQAIREAESRTSGEIVVRLERRHEGTILEHAKKVFDKIGMSKTKHRNGVLIFLSLQGQEFAILGDQGIHDHVGNRFWEETVAHLKEAFSKQDFAGGMVNVILEIGEELKKYFPHNKNDANELPDVVT